VTSAQLLSQVQENVARQLLLHDVVASVEHDFQRFHAIVANAPNWEDKGHPAFDPAWNTLTSDNAFWTCFRDLRGEVVFCAANRIHRDADFVELVRSNRLIYDGTKGFGPNRYTLDYDDGFEHIRGNICYMGSAWVHPRLRGNALPTLALALTQAKALQDYDCDYCLAAIRTVLMEKGVAVNTYRFSHFSYGVKWPRAETGENIELWLMHQNKADMERELSRWLTPAAAAAAVPAPARPAAPIRRIA